MNYLRGDVTEEEFRSGLVDAAIGLSAVVPLAGSLLIRRAVTINFNLILIMLGSFFAVAAYVAVKLHRARSTGSVVLPANVTFLLCAWLTVSMTLVGAAAGGSSSVYRMALPVMALYVAIIGDHRTQMSFISLYVVSFSWMMWENGERGGLLISSILVMTGVLISISTMVRVPVLGLISVQRSRRGIDQITDIALDSLTIEEGLERSLPIVKLVIPASRMIALIRPKGESDFRVLSAWPSLSGTDYKWVISPETRMSVETGRSVVEDDAEVIPVGETIDGYLVLVLELERMADHPMPKHFAQDTGDKLAGSFMRLANHVASVNSLKTRSRTDPLTGLPNRRVLKERSLDEMEKALTDGGFLSVAMIDIDLFKNYNDSFGHVAGDELLRQLAEAMKSRLREADFLARYGGEEFCAILPDTDLQGAYALIDALRQKVHSVESSCPVSVSAGVAMWDRDEDFDSLLDRADRALYAAKAEGRDRVLRDLGVTTPE